MTNIEWLQSLGEAKAIRFIGCFCPKHTLYGRCEECPHYDERRLDTDFCTAFTLGAEALGLWLFKEHKEDEK